MHDAHEFLRSLTVVLAVAAATTVVFQRLRQPVVLGYVVAGLIVGPHVPLPLVADPVIVATLSDAGVILLMFALGLEFSLAKIVRVGPSAGVTALGQSGLMTWLGFLTGRALGWTTLESVFVGAAIAISSTTIIAKVFEEQRIRGPERDLVVGILLVEDLIAVVFMAALTAVATGSGLSAAALAATVGRLAAFLAALVVVGLVAIPRVVRLVAALERDETTLVASIGICFVAAWVAQAAGYSVALGAFLAGSLVAESGHGTAIEHLIRPVRDLFAAVFFVSVGLSIDPALVVAHAGAVAALTAVVLGGKILGVALGAFLTGSSVRTSVQAGMSLAQIGEFSFIIAALGAGLGATREFVYPVAVAVSAVTTLTTPWLIRAAGPTADAIDRRLPVPLQTFTTFYGAWLERVRDASAAPTSAARRLVAALVLDAALLALLVVATAVWVDDGAALAARLTGVGTASAALLVIAVALVAALPFLIGIGRLSARLARTLAETAVPPAAGTLDLTAAPRRALHVTIQLALVLATALAIVAVTQPFLPSYPGPLLLVGLAFAFGVALWQSATDLDGHVRAGSQALVESLMRQARSGNEEAQTTCPILPEVSVLLDGLGAPIAVRLDAQSPAAGRTLAIVNLRAETGASVLAILRDGRAIVPSGSEPLHAGDVLAIAGTRHALTAARTLLLGARTE